VNLGHADIRQALAAKRDVKKNGRKAVVVYQHKGRDMAGSMKKSWRYQMRPDEYQSQKWRSRSSIAVALRVASLQLARSGDWSDPARFASNSPSTAATVTAQKSPAAQRFDQQVAATAAEPHGTEHQHEQ
jgi:hypothetical protein